MKANILLSNLLIFLTLSLNSCVNRTLSIDGGQRLTLKFVKSDEKPENVEKTLEILKNRVSDFGIEDAIFTYRHDSNRLIIDLPLAGNSSRITKLLCSEGKVEFWETYENSEIIKALWDANIKIAKSEKPIRTKNVSRKNRSKERLVLLERLEKENTDETNTLATQNLAENYPLLSILKLNQRQDGTPLSGATVGYAHFKDTAKINGFLKMKLVQDILPKDVKFLWSMKPIRFDQSRNTYELFAIKISEKNGNAPLTGDVVVNAIQNLSQNREEGEICMSMNEDGAKEWAKMTKENIGRCIAIVFDNYVCSAPRVNSEIPSGNSQITGDFTINEAKDLANILKNKKLPAKVEIISEETITGKNYSNFKVVNYAIRLIRGIMFRILS
jgi:SecD/SecF fusion protein